MIITHKLHLDLVRPGDPPRVHIVQRDNLSRCLEVALFADTSPWPIPAAAHVLARYSKPDGHSGEYDSLPDGSPAWSIRDNTVCIMLAPQVCNVSGSVQLSLSLLLDQQLLSSFPILLDVQALPDAAEGSEDYHYVQYYVPQPAAPASPGQLLQIAAVSATGSILSTEAVDVSTLVGTEPLVVTVTMQGDRYLADKTFAQIRAALDAGAYCHADFGGNILPVADANASYVRFMADRRTEDSIDSLVFTLTAGDALSYAFYTKPILTEADVEEIVANKAQGKDFEISFIVGAADDNSWTCTTDKSFAELKAAYDAGRECFAIRYGEAENRYPLSMASDTGFSFMGCGLAVYGAASGETVAHYLFSLTASGASMSKLASGGAGSEDPRFGSSENTAQGSPITIESSYQPPYMKALTLYGKSIQAGTPTQDAPVEIVSVGDGGSMDVTVDDGSENIAISTFTTGLPLYGIPVSSGGNVTVDGQQYIADTLEVCSDGSGKVVRRVGKYFLKNLTPVLIANEKGNYFNYSLRVGAHTGMGSHLKFVTFNYTNVGANKNTFGFTSSKTIMSVIPGQNYTLEEWTAITNDTDMYVLVPLENTTETALTPEEVQAFLAVQTFVPVTNLYNSEDAHMELLYASEQAAFNERMEAAAEGCGAEDTAQDADRSLVVTFTYDDGSATYAANKTFSEIREAIDTGRHCYADYGGNMLYIASASGSKISFVSERWEEENVNALVFDLTADDIVTCGFYNKPTMTEAAVKEILAANAQSKDFKVIFIVREQGDDGSWACMPDKSFVSLKAAFDAGKNCYAVRHGENDRRYPLLMASDTSFSFMGCGLAVYGAESGETVAHYLFSVTENNSASMTKLSNTASA